MSAEDFEFGENEEGQFRLVYDNIIKSKDLLPVTRTLALDLSESGYMSVGDFFKSLSDYDVENLLKISENEEDERFSEIALMAEMLASGEGLTAFKDIDTFSTRIDQFCSFVVIESLARKGLVKVLHENMSFGEEMGDKIIVEKL